MISGKLNEFMDFKDLKDIVFDFKCWFMKNNFIFIGFVGEINCEDIEKKFWDFLYYEVEIEKNIEFNNVYCFGWFVCGKDCFIVVCLLYYVDVIYIIKNLYKF